MKRRTVIGIGVLATMLSVCTVSADYDKEITFRDIPWGSDYETVEKELHSFILMDYTDFQMPYTDDIIGINLGSTENEGTGIYCIFADMDDNFVVAGHKVEYAYLYFADKDNPYFYGAKYCFEFEDYEGTGQDLLEKLSDIYGDEYTDYVTNQFSDEKSYVWNGANNTACSISLGDSFETIEVSYVCKDGDEILEKLDSSKTQKKLDDENAIFGNGDNSGL